MSPFERKPKLTGKLSQLPTCGAQTSRNSSPLKQSFSEELVVTDGKVICVSPQQDMHSLSVSLRNVTRPPNIPCTTGCDTVSTFVRDGNQNCMSAQNLLLVLTDALLTLRSQNKACRPLRGCTHLYEHLHALV